MPKEIKEIRTFLQHSRRKDAKKVIILKSPEQSSGNVVTKFKIRCSRYLYTLVVKDKTKADRLAQSLTPSLEKKEIKGRRKVTVLK
ncbi:unnamed protein product [Amoebophrya sp. A120]|nr:unnamed protein product [Amoebophrya sp. A120]|eukprot:GSA120T00019034001.1